MLRYMKASHIHVCRLLNISGLLLSGRDGDQDQDLEASIVTVCYFFSLYIHLCFVLFVSLFPSNAQIGVQGIGGVYIDFLLVVFELRPTHVHSRIFTIVWAIAMRWRFEAGHPWGLRGEVVYQTEMKEQEEPNGQTFNERVASVFGVQYSHTR